MEPQTEAINERAPEQLDTKVIEYVANESVEPTSLMVEVYRLRGTTSERLTAMPYLSFDVDEVTGKWGPGQYRAQIKHKGRIRGSCEWTQAEPPVAQVALNSWPQPVPPQQAFAPPVQQQQPQVSPDLFGSMMQGQAAMFSALLQNQPKGANVVELLGLFMPLITPIVDMIGKRTPVSELADILKLTGLNGAPAVVGDGDGINLIAEAIRSFPEAWKAHLESEREKRHDAMRLQASRQARQPSLNGTTPERVIVTAEPPQAEEDVFAKNIQHLASFIQVSDEGGAHAADVAETIENAVGDGMALLIEQHSEPGTLAAWFIEQCPDLEQCREFLLEVEQTLCAPKVASDDANANKD